jgi:hypothetical protein
MFKNLYQLFLAYLNNYNCFTIYAKKIPFKNYSAGKLLHNIKTGLAWHTYYIFLLFVQIVINTIPISGGNDLPFYRIWKTSKALLMHFSDNRSVNF